MTEYIGQLSTLIAILALGVSWYLANAANRSARFDQRFSVYQNTDRFLQNWGQHGKPDMDELSVLIGAWDKSHFLFRQPVTDYLRQIWLDAIKADAAEEIIKNPDFPGDRKTALDLKLQLFLKYHDENGSPLRNVFKHALRV